MQTETIYIAPGNSQCRVYVMPYPMRPGQSPSDIRQEFRDQWAEIGLLNAQLKLVCIAPEYADLADDIQGQGGGTFFEVQRPAKVEASASVREPAYKRYGIERKQVYVPADGSMNRLTVVDVETYADCDDVVVFDEAQGQERRVDAFKLAMVRYSLLTTAA